MPSSLSSPFLAIRALVHAVSGRDHTQKGRGGMGTVLSEHQPTSLDMKSLMAFLDYTPFEHSKAS
jgi:hypothetical protein